MYNAPRGWRKKEQKTITTKKRTPLSGLGGARLLRVLLENEKTDAYTLKQVVLFTDARQDDRAIVFRHCDTRVYVTGLCHGSMLGEKKKVTWQCSLKFRRCGYMRSQSTAAVLRYAVILSREYHPWEETHATNGSSIKDKNETSQGNIKTNNNWRPASDSDSIWLK